MVIRHKLMCYFFTRHEGQMYGSLQLYSLSFKIPDSFKILNSNTLHVLSATAIDFPITIFDSFKRVTLPLICINWNHISMRIEQDGRQRWIKAFPSSYQYRSLCIRCNSFMFKSNFINDFLQEYNSCLYIEISLPLYGLMCAVCRKY